MKSGIGLRSIHVQELLTHETSLGFLEAHSENYFGGGAPRQQIRQLAEIYPLSLHSVGLSLGRADGLDQSHMNQLGSLVQELNPLFVSEHLSWSAYHHVHTPDLLPLPLVNEALDIFVAHVAQLQDALGRHILIENPSNYLAFAKTDYSETEFLNTLVSRSGCGLLLDINNIFVSAHNLGYNPFTYVDEIIADGRVQQMHLAGYQINKLANGEQVYLDTHSKPVYPQVWELYQYALRRFGNVSTLIEWDTDIPPLGVLLEEAAKADVIGAHNIGEHGREALTRGEHYASPEPA